MTFDTPSWLVTFLDGVSVWDAVLCVAGIIAVAVFIRKKGWRSIVAVARGIVNSAQILEAVQGLPAYIERADQRHDRLEEKVDGIYHETHKNDGSSIKDAIGGVEDGVAGLHGRMDTVEADIKMLRETDAELRAEIEDTRNPRDDH